jgi:hypothetical protein
MRYKEMTEQLNGNIANLEELEAFVAKVNNPAIYIQNVRNTEKLGRPYHLRSIKKGQELDKEEVEDILQKADPSIQLKPTAEKITSYSAGSPFEFMSGGKRIFIVTRTAIVSGDKKVKIFNKKELTPVTLGLRNVYSNKTELAKDIASKIASKYEGDRADALLEILRNAERYPEQQPIPEELHYLLQGTNLKQISQDFGECIAPICYAKDTDRIEFPAGNEPIVDVVVGGTDIAVKSLSGSGNSLVKMKEIIDAYGDTIDQNDLKAKSRYATIQKLADSNRSVINLILELCTDLQTPEMVQLKADTIPAQEINTLEGLKKVVDIIVNTNGKPTPYKDVIERCKKILSASGKTYGMPRDIASAGPKKYERDPLIYTAYMLTYGLGKGLENQIINGVDKDSYAGTIQDIMKNMSASVGFIGVNANGIIELKVKKFSDLNFKFDYHAYTSNPGNNRPGFAIIN